MKTPITGRNPIFKSLNRVKILIVLALITWIAHFWHSASFGLYEDDYARLPKAMGMTGSELIDYTWSLFVHFGRLTEGRPLHPGLIYLFSFFGEKLGGLNGVYLLGYLLVTVNGFLFYTLLKRVSKDQVFVITGAIGFALFPVYLTRVWLTSSLGHQPSLTFVLLALICYVSGKKKLSYLVILGSLLCYETVFPIFLAAPLFNQKWDRKLLRELLTHTLMLGALVGLIVITRKLTGENRVANLDFWEIILLAIKNMLLGPVMSILMFFSHSLEPLQKLNGELGILMLIGFGVILWGMWDLKQKKMPHSWQELAQLTTIGFIMLILGYSLALTVPVNLFHGGESRVHLGAVVGASILCGCLGSALWNLAIAYRQKRLATVSLAAFFALLIGFGIVVQQDYKLMWQYQQAFWQDVINLAPDMNEGTLILVDGLEHFKRPKNVSQENWTGTFVLKKMYRWPTDWNFPPSLYKLLPNWQEQVVFKENSLQLKELNTVGKKSEREREFEIANIIFLQTENGALTRRSEPLRIEDRELNFKEKLTSGLPPFEKGFLYDYLIQAANSQPISYINN